MNYKLGQHEQAIFDIQSRVKKIEIKVDDLNIWKWKIIGVIIGLSMGGNVLADLILKNLK